MDGEEAVMRLEILIEEIKKQISDGREGSEIGGDIWLIGPLEITEGSKHPRLIGPADMSCGFSISKFAVVGDSLIETYFRSRGGGRAIIDRVKKERMNLFGYNCEV